MKQLFAIYIIIGLFCAPFIYFNNAEGYRPASSKAYQWGKALGGALYWPSYVFSIEPEIDGESLDSFQKSIIDIVSYRNDKLFTGKQSDIHGYMIFTALGNCLALEGADKNHISSLYKEIFSGNTNGQEIERIRSAVMKKMDGYDFADIVAVGAECGEDLDKSLTSATVTALAEKLTSEPTSNNTRSDNPAPVSDPNATLEYSEKLQKNQSFESYAATQAQVQENNISPESQSAINLTKSAESTSTTQKLSAAAEKAIQEGFVEITDPAVQACTDAKIEAIRREVGEDSPINYEMYNEAAVKCGFNI